MTGEIRVVDGIVHIPAQNLIDFAYSMLQNSDGFKEWYEMESWHQWEVNRIYGRYTEKKYEEVPQEAIDKYEEYRLDLIKEMEDDVWE